MEELSQLPLKCAVGNPYEKMRLPWHRNALQDGVWFFKIFLDLANLQMKVWQTHLSVEKSHANPDLRGPKQLTPH